MDQQNGNMQGRPFMAKETFDQVSAVLWGQNALDYQKNYITPRVGWNDFVIREEALHFEGFAKGLRFRALQKASQSTIFQGEPTLPPLQTDSSMSYYPRRDAGYYNTMSSPTECRPPLAMTKPEFDVRPSIETPSHEIPEMAFGSDNTDVPPWVSAQDRTDYARNQAVFSLEHDSGVGKFRSPSDFSIATANSDLQQRQAYQQQQRLHAARHLQMQEHLKLAGMARGSSEPYTESGFRAPVDPRKSRNQAREQAANATEAQAQTPRRAEQFENLVMSGGKAPSFPLVDNQASRHQAEGPFPLSTSLSPAASHHERDPLTATVENASEDFFDEDFDRIDSPSAREQRSNHGDSTSGIGWF